jgi:hypothetical protein
LRSFEQRLAPPWYRDWYRVRPRGASVRHRGDLVQASGLDRVDPS